MKTALLRRTAGGRSAGFLSAFALAFGCALVASTAQNSFAATLTVTTTKDEANCNTTNSGSPNPACVVMNTGGNNYPLSQGCSLREALQNIADAGNGISPQSFPECGNADSGAAATNTIVLPAGNINVNEAVPDPGDSTGMAMKNNGTLPFVGDAATFGKVIVTGGSISCFSDPSATPAIDGVTIFHETSGGDLTFAGVSFSNCTAPSDGVAIDNTGGGGGSLTLTGVAFTNIRATNQGNGGCVAHGSGNLTIAGGSFTTCVVDDGGLIPGGGNGQGGALYIGAVGDSTLATISGVTFQANVAGTNGGAIYLAQTDAISISGAAFQANVANGNTNSSGNAEQGGGAIYATGTARQAISGGGGFNASDFLIFNSSFIGNIAPNGTGGAILLTGGDLTYGSASFDGTVILNKQIPGGIVACNFTGNKAKGTWAGSPVDPRAGSGGAIYASGNLSIVDSSFVGASPANNESTNASGGAIAYYDASNGNSPMAISNVTFSGNAAATNGGAIAILLSPMTNEAGKATLINDTLSGNSAGAGGGGALYNGNATATDVNVSNTIFDSSSSGGNCAGNPFTDGGGNLQFGPTSGCASIANTGNPNLASAAPFGGANALVAVMKLNPGSAASGAGVQSICAASPINNLDAALNSRPSGQPNCDVGAFESGNAPAYASNPTPGSTINMTTLAGTPTSSNVVISNTGTDNLVINTYSLDAGAGPQITVNGAPAPFTIPVGSSTQTLTLGCDNATAGPFTGTLTVTHNAQGSPATYTVNCTVTSPGNPLSITTTSPLPQATVGTLYNQTFAATGGTPPYTNWAITAGTFPSWANLNAATGAMTGTPPDTTGSPFSFTVQVTDSAMVTATKVFTLDVVAPPLSITT
ncbi:MAG TPA: putative Ig domain-containing protein, partial [Rudaea sp.]|nr:putative Ig domain-containing protein [Rudaea sp.]